MNIPRYIPLTTLFLSLFILFSGCRKATDSDEQYDSISSLTEDSTRNIIEQKPDTLTLKSSVADMKRFMSESEHAEEYNKGIIPAMVEEVPQYAVKLLMNKHDGFLIVDKATMKLYRYDKYGVLQESMGMACSKNYGTKHERRDNRTPEGFFSIAGKYDSTDWLYTDDDGNTSDVKGQFGPRFLRLKVPNTSQIGIHGTCAPWSIGGRRSHGCIRVLNENILRLFDIVEVGWPVIVSPGRKDYAVNAEEGYDIPTVPVMPGKPRARYTAHISTRKETEKQEAAPADTVKVEHVPADTVNVKHLPTDSINTGYTQSNEI